MSRRGLVMLALAVCAAGLAWQQRDRLQAAWAAASAAATGTRTAAESAPPGARPAGELRKCVKGTQVTYTNAPCPAGYQAQAVGGTPVNVLPATPVAPPEAGSSAPSSLHKALDLTRDDKLRDRIMERAVEGATR